MALCGGLLTATAQTARDDIGKNVWLAGSNYLDYDRQLPSFNYTKAPIVLLNRSATSYDSRAKLIITEPIGEVLSQIEVR